MSKKSSILNELKSVGKDAVHTSLILFKIMIPVSIIVKIFELTGFIEIIGLYLSPIMEFVGLQGETGLVWATAMITNIYGGIIVFISLSSEMVFTIDQVTILCSMILIAHSLPVEVTIARKAGAQVWFTLVFRIGCAFIFGFILHQVFSFFNILKSPSVMAWQANPKDASIVLWIFNQLKNYVLIFCIIFAMLLLMYILKRVGIIKKINSFMEPGLELLGMSKDAAPLTIIGTTLGISYGGGLIIKDIQSGIVGKKDAFLSVSLMGLSHSLIEDTLLMLTIGGSLIGILFGRVLFSILIMIVFIRIINRLSNHTFQKYFLTPLKNEKK